MSCGCGCAVRGDGGESDEDKLEEEGDGNNARYWEKIIQLQQKGTGVFTAFLIVIMLVRLWHHGRYG